MTTAYCVLALFLATLVGLFVSGAYRHALAFVAYAASILILGSLAIVDPDTWNTWEWFCFRHDLYDGLSLAVAGEIALYTLAAFPGAAARTRLHVLAMLVLSTAFLAFAPALLPFLKDNSAVGAYMTGWPDWEVRLSTITLWLFALVGLTVVWYHLPLEPWHQHLLLGFILQLALTGGMASQLSAWGWWIFPVLDSLRTRADVFFALWWAVGAWTPEKAKAPAAVPALSSAR